MFCGGTIAMARNPESGALEPKLTPEQLYSLAPKIKDHADIAHVVKITDKDSSDIDSSDWKKMCRFIHQNQDKYDAFVMTHGTDTMAYTANAIAYAFGKSLKKPVVITGSMAEPDALRSDAASNIEGAVATAISTRRPEVLISFDRLVLRGTRARKVRETGFDAFSSTSKALAEHMGGRPAWNVTSNPARPAFISDKFKPMFSQRVITIPLESGQDADFINRRLLGEDDQVDRFAKGLFGDARPRGFQTKYFSRRPMTRQQILEEKKRKEERLNGLVWESLGSGNVPAVHHATLKRALDLNVPIVVVSSYPGRTLNMTAYAPGLEALKIGAIPAGDMTREAASVKLKWLLGVAEHEISKGRMDRRNLVAFVRNQFFKSRAKEITLPKRKSGRAA